MKKEGAHEGPDEILAGVGVGEVTTWHEDLSAPSLPFGAKPPSLSPAAQEPGPFPERRGSEDEFPRGCSSSPLLLFFYDVAGEMAETHKS